MTAVPTAARATSPWLPHAGHHRGDPAGSPGHHDLPARLRRPRARGRLHASSPGSSTCSTCPASASRPSRSAPIPATRSLLHTIRVAGNVTQALAQETGRRPDRPPRPVRLELADGGVQGARRRDRLRRRRPGPARGRRSTTSSAIGRDYGRVFLLYGARTPGDLLYADEYDAWREADIEVEVTVDIGDRPGGATSASSRCSSTGSASNAARTIVLTCGPEIMIRFVVFEALARKIPPEQIYLSMERNMNCAIGHCGHCQLGPAFVCKDGPVFTYRQMEPYMHLEDF